MEEEEVAQALAQETSIIELILERGQCNRRTLRPFVVPEINEVQKAVAGSEVLDPESPEDMFEPFARGGLLKQGSLIKRAYDRAKRGIHR
jgi:hypothetical protein